MKKHIDSEKLIAEIRQLRSESCISEEDDYYEFAKSEIIDIITSLQQEQSEVDLEKEFAHEYAIYHLPTFIIASIVDGTELIDFIYKTAHHFWNKGYNARKEE